MTMRLRQIALASYDLDKVTHGLEEVFGLQVAYNDPGIHHYGLKNAVLHIPAPGGLGAQPSTSPVL